MEYIKYINPLQIFVDLYNKKIEEDSEKEGFQTTEIHLIQMTPLKWFISFIVGVFALYLSQIRNKHESTGTRILYGLLAYMFSIFYILYYFVTKK